jgi:hypothetical protein
VNRRTVLFVAFSGEERGLLGSTHLLAHLNDLGLKREQIVAMLNMDMIGRMSNNRLIVLGTRTAKAFPRLVEDANRDVRLDLRLDTDNSTIPGASDQVSFYVQRIPAVALFTGVHGDYHRPSDTVDRVNTRGGERIAAFAAELVRQMRREPERMAYTGEAVDPHLSRGGMRPGGPMLGVVPDYGTLDAADGCGISGVVPGGPAEQAGLRGGDVIVGWNGKPVRNVYDLTELIGASKAGETVKLRVKRGGEEVEVEVVLRAR